MRKPHNADALWGLVVQSATRYAWLEIATQPPARHPRGGWDTGRIQLRTVSWSGRIEREGGTRSSRKPDHNSSCNGVQARRAVSGSQFIDSRPNTRTLGGTNGRVADFDARDRIPTEYGKRGAAAYRDDEPMLPRARL